MCVCAEADFAVIAEQEISPLYFPSPSLSPSLLITYAPPPTTTTTTAVSSLPVGKSNKRKVFALCVCHRASALNYFLLVEIYLAAES